MVLTTAANSDDANGLNEFIRLATSEHRRALHPTIVHHHMPLTPRRVRRFVLLLEVWRFRLLGLWLLVRVVFFLPRDIKRILIGTVW